MCDDFDNTVTEVRILLNFFKQKIYKEWCQIDLYFSFFFIME